VPVPVPAPMRYARAVAEPAPADDDAEPRRLGLHLGLFLATCATTFLAGGLAGGTSGVVFDPASGLAFSGTLMLILTCHEMGHFVVARRRGIPASLPFFIPLPPGISLGTMGAVIRMRQPIADRNHLVDVGASGPLAGLAVAIPLLVVGLALSPLGTSPAEGAVVEGNSLLYLALKYAVHGQILPAPDGTDVQLHPIGFAAWVGLLITFINLIPVGQLDGGHVAAGYLGDRHERLSSRLHRLLLAAFAGVFTWLLVDGTNHGLSLAEAAGYAVQGALPWLVWAVLLLVLKRASGGRYHPPARGAPLGHGRRRLVAFMALVFIAIFTPVPLRPVLPVPAPAAIEAAP
jgi:membrane-associated protease RseP (regulator of RpoE activity)